MTRAIRRWSMMGVAAGVVLLLTGAWWLHAANKVDAAPNVAPSGPIKITALGRLEPHSRVIQLAAPGDAASARVEQLHVREGDEVTAGAIVATLDNHHQKSAALREAEAKIAVAQAKLEQIKAGTKPAEIAAQEAVVARLEAVYRSAQADMDRYKQAGNSVSGLELNRQRMELDRSRLELEQARNILAGLREVREVDVRLQEQEIASARAAAAKAQADRDATIIRTPVAGRVLKIHTYPGARIGEKGVLEVGDTARMDAVAEVYESDVQRVKIGQTALVRLRSTNQTLTGEVAEIGLMIGRKDVLNNDPVADTDARVVEVRVRLSPKDSRKVAGMTNARVEIEIQPN